MIEVKGLPIEITKADLDTLFSPYGTIQITKTSVVIKIGKERSVAYIELDTREGENRASRELNDSPFRNGFQLRLGPPMGDGRIPGFPVAGNVGTQDNDD